METAEESKLLYKASGKKGDLIEIPESHCISINGKGRPRSDSSFENSIQVLYKIAYTLKFGLKKSGGPEFKVKPLESLWWMEDYSHFDNTQPEKWRWKLLIIQPNFISIDDFTNATNTIKNSKEVPALIDKVNFESLNEGLCFQQMYTGPWGDAQTPFIVEFYNQITEQGYVPNGLYHEIYMNDARRTAPEKLKTIIRQHVKKQQATRYKIKNLVFKCIFLTYHIVNHYCTADPLGIETRSCRMLDTSYTLLNSYLSIRPWLYPFLCG